MRVALVANGASGGGLERVTAEYDAYVLVVGS